jgi:hypothetical protein
MISCNHASNTRHEKLSIDRLLKPVSHDRYADDVGRFLAGLPARSDSPLAGLQDNSAWARHRRDLDRAWTRIEEQRLLAMRMFQQAELSIYSVAKQPVFYPFSGPDVLTVTVLLPQSPIYVMVGLEPAGTLPTPKQLDRKNLGEYLAATRSTLASELGKSFFVTRQMDRQFRGQVTDGLCLPILELLVRSHHTILGFQYVRLDDSGQIMERAADYHAPGVIGNKGVEIEFLSETDRSAHKLFYFSVNLSDTRLQENRPFFAFLSVLKGCTTFLKATSYMVHRPDFSIIRGQILSKSNAILQDDSGVPYHFFLSPSWRVQLYGGYDRPYGSFRWLIQPDLRNAYLTLKPKPLPFRIGYGSRHAPSNLLFATRLEQSRTAVHEGDRHVSWLRVPCKEEHHPGEDKGRALNAQGAPRRSSSLPLPARGVFPPPGDYARRGGQFPFSGFPRPCGYAWRNRGCDRKTASAPPATILLM